MVGGWSVHGRTVYIHIHVTKQQQM